ncbi:Chloroperoxidase [Mycena amicta]|nr:Chloroperoxidase [Mycena amicta]
MPSTTTVSSERQPLLNHDKTAPTPSCPVSGHGYEYIPPREGDIRSVCPAINAMANHGYIPRNGQGITPYNVFRGLRACYGLSIPLAITLTAGGWFFIKRFFGQTITLLDLGAHGGVEHDASVVHANTPTPLPTPGKDGKLQFTTDRKGLLAPVEIHPKLVEEFVTSIRERATREADTSEYTSTSPTKLIDEDAVLVNGHDIVQTRLRREKTSAPLTALYAELARGEMAIILGVWERPTALSPRSPTPAPGIPLPWMRRWLAEERMPEGWRPSHVQTLRDVIRRSNAMRLEMKAIREAEARV